MEYIIQEVYEAFLEGGEEAVHKMMRESYEEHIRNIAICEAEDGEHGLGIASRMTRLKRKYKYDDYVKEYESDTLKTLEYAKADSIMRKKY